MFNFNTCPNKHRKKCIIIGGGNIELALYALYLLSLILLYHKMCTIITVYLTGLVLYALIGHT